MTQNIAYKRSSYTGGFAVTPDNAVDLPNPVSALYAGSAGDILVTTNLGNIVLIDGVSAGDIIPVNVVRVWASVTTVTNIVGLM